MLLCGYLVKGMLAVEGAVPCQKHWHQVHTVRGVAGVHTSGVSELMHPAHASEPTINPLKQTCSGGVV
jgi:hypothetical protein